MGKKLGNVLKYGVSFVLAAVLVWLVVRKIDWASILAGLKNTRWLWCWRSSSVPNAGSSFSSRWTPA